MDFNKLTKLSLIALGAVALAACQGGPWGHHNTDQTSYSSNSSVPPWHFSEDYSPGHTDITTQLIKLTKHIPSSLTVGETFETATDVMARKPIARGVVTEVLPAGTVLVKSDPQVKVIGNKLMWNLGSMDRGEMKTLRVWLKAREKGTTAMCTTVSAIPRTCHTIAIRQPQIEVDKKGPERVELGNKFDYEIIVKNKGDGVAKNVHLQDVLPDELHGNDTGPLKYKIGDLAPGQMTNPIIIHATANKRGDFCNHAKATSDNHPFVDQLACTTVYQPLISIKKTGPEEAHVGKAATYNIDVANPGDTVLSDVRVDDSIPTGTRILSAPGGNMQGRDVTWRMDSLAPGQKKHLTVTLTSKDSGKLCNTVTANSASVSDVSEACTMWHGVPSLGVTMIDSRDSLLVGDRTDYLIHIINQGSASSEKVDMVATFPNTIQPIQGGAGKGVVQGNKVTFSIPNLKPQESRDYRIESKAIGRGNKKVVLTVNGKILAQPVVVEESTIVY